MQGPRRVQNTQACKRGGTHASWGQRGVHMDTGGSVGLLKVTMLTFFILKKKLDLNPNFLASFFDPLGF